MVSTLFSFGSKLVVHTRLEVNETEVCVYEQPLGKRSKGIHSHCSSDAGAHATHIKDIVDENKHVRRGQALKKENK